MLFMIALDTCNSSVYHDIVRAQTKYNNMTLDKYSGEDIPAWHPGRSRILVAVYSITLYPKKNWNHPTVGSSFIATSGSEESLLSKAGWTPAAVMYHPRQAAMATHPCLSSASRYGTSSSLRQSFQQKDREDQSNQQGRWFMRNYPDYIPYGSCIICLVPQEEFRKIIFEIDWLLLTIQLQEIT